MLGNTYDHLPDEVKTILSGFDEYQDLYAECKRIAKELNQIGWSCDYGLDGVITEVYQSKNQ